MTCVYTCDEDSLGCAKYSKYSRLLIENKTRPSSARLRVYGQRRTHVSHSIGIGGDEGKKSVSNKDNAHGAGDRCSPYHLYISN